MYVHLLTAAGETKHQKSQNSQPIIGFSMTRKLRNYFVSFLWIWLSVDTQVYRWYDGRSVCIGSRIDFWLTHNWYFATSVCERTKFAPAHFACTRSKWTIILWFSHCPQITLKKSPGHRATSPFPISAIAEALDNYHSKCTSATDILVEFLLSWSSFILKKYISLCCVYISFRFLYSINYKSQMLYIFRYQNMCR